MAETAVDHDPHDDRVMKEYYEWLRNLTLEQRGEIIMKACASAGRILQARRKLGLPDPEPEPWPESTIEFMRKNAANRSPK